MSHTPIAWVQGNPPTGGYRESSVYAQLAATAVGINERRTTIGQSLTSFTYLGTNPASNALVGDDTGGLSGGVRLWAPNIIQDLLPEMVTSIEFCAQNTGTDSNGHTRFWVDADGTPYTGKSTVTTPDYDTVQGWQDVISQIQDIIEALEINTLYDPVGAPTIETKFGDSEELTSGSPPADLSGDIPIPYKVATTGGHATQAFIETNNPPGPNPDTFEVDELTTVKKITRNWSATQDETAIFEIVAIKTTDGTLPADALEVTATVYTISQAVYDDYVSEADAAQDINWFVGEAGVSLVASWDTDTISSFTEFQIQLPAGSDLYMAISFKIDSYNPDYSDYSIDARKLYSSDIKIVDPDDGSTIVDVG